MNAKIRDRIKHFLRSEGGRVGLKTPMALGVAGGSLLAAQVVLFRYSEAVDSGFRESDLG